MRRRNCYALIFLVLLVVKSRAETACVDPALLAGSTVSITRYFDAAEQVSDVIGIQGAGWIQSSTTIVTVEHVAVAMGLSTQDWKSIKIGDGELISVRIQRWVGGRIERLAVLKLQNAVAAAQSSAIRTSPLAPEDRVITFAGSDRNPRSVLGRFVQYAGDGRLAGGALLEVYEGENRFVIDHGASGTPVFDCEGRIVALISTVITQILRTPFGDMRTSTAWGSPNVVSVPVHPLTVELSDVR